jgi:deazaflavin-dependent oxidoreductase (nitroreductase family)
LSHKIERISKGIINMIQPVSQQESLRQGFKYFNRFMLLMWRLGLGPMLNWWPKLSGRILVIQHTGRKSGLRRRTPVNYAIVDGEIYCTAGFGHRSDWFLNIQADPNVEVWLPDSWWSGTAQDVSSDPRRLYLLRQVLIGSGFAAFAAGINPYKISDEALEKVACDYCLVCIQRRAARTGPGGPGELAWIWPLATMILLPLVLFRRRK